MPDILPREERNESEEGLTIKFRPIEGIKSYLFEPSFMSYTAKKSDIFARLQFLCLLLWAPPFIGAVLFNSLTLFIIAGGILMTSLTAPLLYWIIKFWVSILFKVEKDPDCYR